MFETDVVLKFEESVDAWDPDLVFGNIDDKAESTITSFASLDTAFRKTGVTHPSHCIAPMRALIERDSTYDKILVDQEKLMLARVDRDMAGVTLCGKDQSK